MGVQLLCNHSLTNMAGNPGVDGGTGVTETNLRAFLLFLLLISSSWEIQSLYEFMGRSSQWVWMISGCDMVKQEDSRTAVTRLEVKNWHTQNRNVANQRAKVEHGTFKLRSNCCQGHRLRWKGTGSGRNWKNSWHFAKVIWKSSLAIHSVLKRDICKFKEEKTLQSVLRVLPKEVTCMKGRIRYQEGN